MRIDESTGAIYINEQTVAYPDRSDAEALFFGGCTLKIADEIKNGKWHSCRVRFEDEGLQAGMSLTFFDGFLDKVAFARMIPEMQSLSDWTPERAEKQDQANRLLLDDLFGGRRRFPWGSAFVENNPYYGLSSIFIVYTRSAK